MAQATKKLYFLHTCSNLHAGSDTSSSGAVDKLIQRDTTDGFPAVFLSSFKGALKEWAEKGPEKDTLENKIDTIFGGSKQKGAFSGSDVHLLAYPLRSNKKPYYMATCPYLIDKFFEIAADFGVDVDSNLITALNTLKSNAQSDMPVVFSKEDDQMAIEDFEKLSFCNDSNENLSVLKALWGDNFMIISNEDMKYFLSDYALPIIARNKLENGQSVQLWYEQVLPRKTAMYCIIEVDNGDSALFTALDKEPIIQVGANATIGYGKCKILKSATKCDQANN